MSLKESQQTDRELVCLHLCLSLPDCFLFRAAIYLTFPGKTDSTKKLLSLRAG